MFLYAVIAAGVIVVGVVIALALGLFNYVQEGEQHRRASNKLMQWRVGLQLGAVLLILLALAVAGR